MIPRHSQMKLILRPENSKTHKSESTDEIFYFTQKNLILIIIFRFYKIFVSYLEEEFKKSPIPRVHHLIEQQFQGKSQYITICQNCHTESIRDSSFYELELGIDVRTLYDPHFSSRFDI